jgi:hypothetical protein
MAEIRLWTADVIISETEDRTRARVILRMGDVERVGKGLARRSAADPNVPRIGEELATARAFNDLSHQLLNESADMLESAIGHPIELYS